MRLQCKLVLFLFCFVILAGLVASFCTYYALTYIEGAYECNPFLAMKFATYGVAECMPVIFVVNLIQFGIPSVGFFGLDFLFKKYRRVQLALFLVCFVYLGFWAVVMGADMVNDILYVVSH